LTATDVIEIRKLRRQGWSFPRLADRFGIGASQVFRITSGKQWAHIKDGGNS
jgi:transcriptional regulator with XRE-family HTH domain